MALRTTVIGSYPTRRPKADKRHRILGGRGLGAHGLSPGVADNKRSLMPCGATPVDAGQRSNAADDAGRAITPS